MEVVCVTFFKAYSCFYLYMLACVSLVFREYFNDVIYVSLLVMVVFRVEIYCSKDVTDFV